MVIMEKKTQSRRKIEMKKIKKLSNRQVTFSKRRVSLFKKESKICVLTGTEVAIVKICVLTGTEVAIVVQSLTGKRVFTFGHSSVNSIIARIKNEITYDGSAKNYNKTPD
ncbi:agamous-like MADS-box protein AGL62 [Olea europaea var. sylvestris]|uniref:agamous-like MADS-box protein AGL62 n=1 Tax=Olea europaea var. sylvestris TaxID=158386 RepID=UPI000C1D6A01|nr:agamous-like MADS-box protein AGL62 [Olea europaea var. sylvestris]